MADFASVFACCGKRPQCFQSAHIEERPHLVQRMASQRNVARFLVAPSGYGKTYLALEYAQELFGFCEVVWLDASNSEFLRALDAGRLKDDVSICEPQASLVVVDGVSHMDVVRADELSRCMDAWLEAGIEVIATMVPSSDAFSRRQLDRLLLNGRDFLLPDGGDPSHSEEGIENRIASIRWGRAEGLSDFAARCAAEALPAELACMSFYLLASGQGSLSSLLFLFPRRESSAALLLLARYPHLGIDLERKTFCALRIDPSVLFGAYGSVLDQFSQVTGLRDFDSLVGTISQECLGENDAVRACDVVRAFGSAHLRREWAVRHGADLLWSLNVLPLLRLLDGIDQTQGEEGAQILTLRAAACFVLDDHEGAQRAASRVMQADCLDRLMLLGSLLLLSRVGGPVEEKYAVSRASELLKRASDLTEKEMLLAALATKDRRALAAYHACVADEGGSRLLEIACCWMFEDFPLETLPLLEKYMNRLDSASQLDLGGLMTAKACQHAAGMGLVPLDALSSDVVVKLFHTEAALLTARIDRGGDAESVAIGNERLPKTNGTALEEGVRSVPVLEITLFGSFSVSVGGRPIDRKQLNRTSSRVMLTLLALNAGREYPRERLAHELWPDSNEENARRNCYTAWSALRRALRLSDGSCPYLSALSHGYRLEKIFLKLDVDRVRRICEEFRLGEVDNEAWQGLLLELEGIVAGGLTPGEGYLQVVEEARRSVQQRVTDSLVIGSERLLSQGFAMSALGFVDAIVKEHQLREDVCFARMRAQVGCDQRQEALATFFAVKQHLQKEYGIEPSARLTRLYAEIIKDKGQSDGLMDFK